MTGGPASSGHALAAIVDAAIPHAIGAIPAQSICLGLPRSGNVGSERAQREEGRRRRDLRDGARIDGIVMHGIVMHGQIAAGAELPACATELGAATARAASAKAQANPASALILLESLISSSIRTPTTMGLAGRRLARMELERAREAFQLWFAMIIIGLFDRSRRRCSRAEVHCDCCGKLRMDDFNVKKTISR